MEVKDLYNENYKPLKKKFKKTSEVLFLNRIQMTKQLREKIDKWDCMKPESFCTTKEMSPD
jgi:hypothetical protein